MPSGKYLEQTRTITTYCFHVKKAHDSTYKTNYIFLMLPNLSNFRYYVMYIIVVTDSGYNRKPDPFPPIMFGPFFISLAHGGKKNHVQLANRPGPKPGL